MKHFLSVTDVSKKEIDQLIKKAITIKKHPKRFAKKAFEKNLLLIFGAPSLRTRVSFETAMVQLGGDTTNYYTEHSPWGHGKETIEDMAKTISRYVDGVAARIYSHEELVKFAKNASVPVISAMTNFEHPCQILGDLMTIMEKKKKLKGLTLAYCGDGNNNVTHSLLYGCSLVGMNINIACPKGKDFMPLPKVLKEAKVLAKKSGAIITITQNAKAAAKNADVIYTDSWMSYRIKKAQKNKRLTLFKPYQVNKQLFSLAPKAIFMHCLPAWRGHEVTADVIDSEKSVVFDQAENRLHMEKAIILQLVK